MLGQGLCDDEGMQTGGLLGLGAGVDIASVLAAGVVCFKKSIPTVPH